MKKIIIYLLLVLPCAAQAQSGLLEKIKNKAKAKAEQRILNKADKEIDKTLDEVEGTAKGGPSKPATTAPAQKETAKEASKETAPSITAYSKYDFVPGERIIYSEDFSQDEIGELPVGWNTSGKAELVTLDEIPGRWLRLYQNALYLTSNKDTFSRNFTVEFDIVLQLKNIGYTYPQLSLGFLASHDLPTIDNTFLDGFTKYQAAHVFLRPSEGGNTNTYVETFLERKRTFLSETQNLAALEKYYHKITHVAMQVQEKRWRVWINGEKKFDLPMAMPTDYMFNQLYFKLHWSSHKDDQVGVYLGNLKVATGKPDTRHKLVEEGKFSTTGILFDVNSAVIKPESAGVLKEIADVLKKFPDVKVNIIGHTDSDGQDAANLTLSQKRAASVKQSLVSEYGIDESRLQSDGKGEKEPVGDNKTKPGKAQNRRVEFIKTN
ncbi:MAG: OmpA family protein [Chitinophagaceae bacterium]